MACCVFLLLSSSRADCDRDAYLALEAALAKLEQSSAKAEQQEKRRMVMRGEIQGKVVAPTATAVASA